MSQCQSSTPSFSSLSNGVDILKDEMLAAGGVLGVQGQPLTWRGPVSDNQPYRWICFALQVRPPDFSFVQPVVSLSFCLSITMCRHSRPSQTTGPLGEMAGWRVGPWLNSGCNRHLLQPSAPAAVAAKPCSQRKQLCRLSPVNAFTSPFTNLG